MQMNKTHANTPNVATISRVKSAAEHKQRVNFSKIDHGCAQFTCLGLPQKGNTIEQHSFKKHFTL